MALRRWTAGAAARVLITGAPAIVPYKLAIGAGARPCGTGRSDHAD
jgi:hypothetical protein